jgi:hypothetical protein
MCAIEMHIKVYLQDMSIIIIIIIIIIITTTTTTTTTYACALVLTNVKLFNYGKVI